MADIMCRIYLPEHLFWTNSPAQSSLPDRIKLYGHYLHTFSDAARSEDNNGPSSSDRGGENHIFYVINKRVGGVKEGDCNEIGCIGRGSVTRRRPIKCNTGPFIEFRDSFTLPDAGQNSISRHIHLHQLHLPNTSQHPQSIQLVLYNTKTFLDLSNSLGIGARSNDEASNEELVRLSELINDYDSAHRQRQWSLWPTSANRVIQSSVSALLRGLVFILMAFNWLFRNTASAKHFREWDRVFGPLFVPSASADKQQSPQRRAQIWSLAVDILLGITITLWLLWCVTNPGQYVMAITNEIVKQLRSLLEGLRGSPVGLKVNVQLNDFLLNCFIYHVNLWRTFLYIVSPAINQLFITTLTVFGCCGLSFQLAMLSDLMQLITIHAHCFYIYAAVLYRTEVVGLKALWRVVLGRRKNVLKNRVESCDYDPQQLFLATLFFASLLFLLPTVLVYYVVFATLRLGTYCITYGLWLIRRQLLLLPIYAGMRMLLGIHISADNVMLDFVPAVDVVRSEELTGAVTVVRVKPGGSSKLSERMQESDAEAKENSFPSIGQFIGDLIRGEIKGFIMPKVKVKSKEEWK